MRAAIFRGPGLCLDLRTVPDPVPQATDVVLKVVRCGICGTDLSMTGPAAINYEVGSALGHEFAGEIVATGSGVERLRVGDRVAVMPVDSCGHCRACLSGDPFFCAEMCPRMGGFGEYAAASETACFPLPDSLTFADGAIVEPLAVGSHGIDMAALRPGADVLILGSGAVALAMAFWARRRGAVRVIMVARSLRNRAIARTMGATHCLSFDELERDRALTAQIVIECIGVPGMLAKALERVKPRGTVVVAGLCLTSDSIVPALSVFKEVRIQTAVGYSVADFAASLDALACDPAIPRTMVTESIGLSDLPRRFEQLRTERHACKVLVDPWV